MQTSRQTVQFFDVMRQLLGTHTKFDKIWLMQLYTIFTRGLIKI